MSQQQPQQPPDPPRQSRPRKDKYFLAFRRACGFLWPYRATVLVSVVCALFVGLASAGGVTAFMPIMKILIENKTVPEWIDQAIVEHRLGVRFEEGGDVLEVGRVKEASAASEAGIATNDQLLPDNATSADRSNTLATLADPSATGPVTFSKSGKSVSPQPVPWYYARARDVGRHFPTNPVWAIATVCGFIGIIVLAGNIVRFFQEYLSDRAAILAVHDVRRRLYDHVLHVPMSFFGRHGTSDVTSRLVSDAQELQQGFKTVLGPTVQQPIIANFYFGLAMLVSWRLTLFIVIFAPLMGIVVQKFGKKMRRASRSALQKSASMLGQLEGTLTGIRVVKAHSAERFERRRYSSIMRQLVGFQLKMSRADAMSSPALESIAMIVIFSIVLYASYSIFVTKTLEPTSFFLVMACLAGMADSLRKIAKVNNQVQKSNSAAERIFETLDMPAERTILAPGRRNTSGNGKHASDGPLRRRLAPIQHEVRFDSVTFAYPGTMSPAVIGVSLKVEKGTSVAVVGRNGSGKTTLLALLPRFYDPSAGVVSIDGVDVRDVTLKSLRGQISIVTQDAVIFPGTIAQNIAYGHPLAGELDEPTEAAKLLREQVESAARRAFAHEFIVQKPQGYDTPLDGLGGQLSGGQRQRLNIARAILRKAPILILDEATSQVDAESEHLIQQAIVSLMKDRTTFVIAHRFSTILSADTIVVMDQGKIVGQGKHEVLLQTCPTYLQLYERQLVGSVA